MTGTATELTGQTALITGRDHRRGQTVLDELPGVRFIPADLADAASVASLVDQAGDVDIRATTPRAFPER